MIEIKQASMLHLAILHPVFEQYRQFYQMPMEKSASFKFLKERLKKKDSIILLAFDAQELAGFIQIYPSFSSVAMQPVWQLNDLFVVNEKRRKGIARKLMLAVEELAKKQQIFAVKLATAINNQQAKNLYESLDYQQNQEFDFYSKRIK